MGFKPGLVTPHAVTTVSLLLLDVWGKPVLADGLSLRLVHRRTWGIYIQLPPGQFGRDKWTCTVLRRVTAVPLLPGFAPALPTSAATWYVLPARLVVDSDTSQMRLHVVVNFPFTNMLTTSPAGDPSFAAALTIIGEPVEFCG